MKQLDQRSMADGLPQPNASYGLDRTHSRRTSEIVIAALLALAVMPQNGLSASFTTGFDPDVGLPGNLYGKAVLDPSGGTADGAALKLTQANGDAGALVLEDLDGGLPIGSFAANFKLRMGNDSSSPPQGDGFSFSFGPEIPDAVFPFPEEGAGTGLIVSFDSFNNAGPAGEAPAVEVKYNNQIIASKKVGFLPTGKSYVDVRIQADRDGTLDVAFGNNLVFSNLLCFPPTAGRFALAANSAVQRFVGDPIDMHWVDDLSITTTLAEHTAIQSSSPRGTTVRPDAVVRIDIVEVSTHVKSDSIQLKLNGNAVNGNLSRAGGVATVTYDPPGLLLPGSTHRVELSYSDDGIPSENTSVAYEFTVAPYVTLPPSYAVPETAINKGAPGFKVWPHQVAKNLGTSVERAELQFAGKLLDPADGTVLENMADLSGADVDGSYPVEGFLDFSSTGDPTGFLTDDVAFPGVNRPFENYALEVITYLELTPGAYTFGIGGVRNYNTTADGSYRESGFRLTAGPNPRQLFAPEVASFDKSRPEGFKEFSFVVEAAGIYPFRLLWFSGVGASSLEWYRVTSEGTRVHLADVASGGVPAYREALITHPSIQYTTVPKPNESQVSANTTIAATLVDGLATVNPASIQLSLNGSIVAATITKDAGSSLTQISFDPPGSLPSGSTNIVRLVYSDTDETTSDNQWTFVVEGTLDDPGLIVIEAESFDEKTTIEANNHTWELTTANAGFSGEGAMEATPNVNLNVNIDISISPRLDYNVEFNLPGLYYVWVRGLADSAPGLGQNDSINVGIDGTLPATSDRIGFFPQGAGYVWSNVTLDGNTRATLLVSTPGRHLVNVWMREDGFIIDKLILSTNPDYQPAGAGPAVKPALVVVEAEHFDRNTPVESNGHAWEVTTATSGYSGDGAMEATPNVNLNVNIDTTVSPRLDYNIEIVKPGTYYVWVRGLADSAPGLGQNDSINVGIDGTLPATSDRIGFFPQGAGYVWSSTTLDGNSRATFQVSQPGVHQLNIWMREDGFIVDKVLLVSDPNYTPAGAGPAEKPALLVVESEQFDNKVDIEANGHSWQPSSATAGFSGEGAMEALPNVNLNVNIDTTISPRLDYNIEFVKTGSYYVWIRGLADSAPGLGQNDSINVGIDGTLPATSDRIGFFPQGAGYVWSGTTLDGNSRAVFQVTDPGVHQLNIWMREDGFLVDKLLVTTDANYTPVGVGPAASARSISSRPRLRIEATANGLQISWTGGGALHSAETVDGPYSEVAGGAASPVQVTPGAARSFYRVVK